MTLEGIKTYLSDLRPGQKLSFILGFLSALIYIQIAFYTDRADTNVLLWCFTALFVMHLLLIKSILSYRFIIGFGILFRLIFIFSIPELSDDFYRFFWDGVLVNNQINPFLYPPREIIENSAISISALDVGLFESLNSPEYYSVYPPICQLIFWVSAYLGGENITAAVMIMKGFMLLAELGSIFLIIELLKIYHLKKEYIFFYALNPLLIIELVGNIHFEAFLIVFVLLAVFLLHQNKFVLSSVAFAVAISAKLTPIVLLPFFLKRLKIQKALVFYCLTLVFALATFLPFFSAEFIHGISSSLSLYFQKFEFNASIFYIVREIGFWVKGWDIIQVASKWLALSTVIVIAFITLFENSKKQNIPGIFIWPLFIYLAFASIIHPWYITPIIAFSLFSKYRFPLVWSFTIFLSYSGYRIDGFEEQLWVLLTEYLLVYGVMIYELIKHKDLIRLKNPIADFIVTKGPVAPK